MTTAAFDADGSSDKPLMLKAIERVIADPAELRSHVLQHFKAYEARYGKTKPHHDIQSMIARKVVGHYANLASLSGGLTSLTGVIPGLGTALAMVGGGAADAVACMKFQVEMVLELATVYGHDVTREECKRMCFVIAGVGALNHAAAGVGTEVAGKAAQRMIREYLKGSTLLAVKDLFRQIGVTFVRKNLEKAAPLGIGVVISAGLNQAITRFVGGQAIAYLKAA